MNQDLINRYQAGGDIYAQLAAQYGIPGADAVAAAALTGDETQVNVALTVVKHGQPLNASTWSIFGNQLATDPLAAPLASANNLIGNSFLSFLKNPMVLLVVAGVAFFSLGGAGLIRKHFNK